MKINKLNEKMNKINMKLPLDLERIVEQGEKRGDND